MYISKITLSEDAFTSRGSNLGAKMFLRTLTGDQYGLHQMVWDFFPETEGQDRDFLYRLDVGQDKFQLEIVSARKPKEAGAIWNVETYPYEPAVRAGDRFSFRARVNAVKADGNNGSRHDVTTLLGRRTRQEHGEGDLDWSKIAHEALGQWLEKKEDRHGFKALRHAVENRDRVEMHKPKARRPIVIYTTDLSGILECTDRDRFLHTVYKGIGRARGFGCGLLSLRRIA